MVNGYHYTCIDYTSKINLTVAILFMAICDMLIIFGQHKNPSSHECSAIEFFCAICLHFDLSVFAFVNLASELSCSVNLIE